MTDLLLLSRWLDAVPGFLRERVPAGARIGFVPTASAIYPDTAWVDLDRDTLRGQGWHTVDLDVESLSAAQLAARLADVDAVFVAGGNVFHLLGALRRSGGAQVLACAVTAGLPYIGVSAGAVVVGPDIGALDLLDDPAEAAPLDDTAGLGLIDVTVVPHADGRVGGLGRITETRRRYADAPLLFLRDDESLLVVDGVRTILPMR
ncbi:Type 1 glutamine amidotransferase-like domain-containing protein [Gordonia sp. ABSL1-1]|uniref:Type 1 glutamine amidotransferase-like domain-containing protein n=1 Tax=Gordonia sp. ABSL1-1 TaxID=3053923 RepID=UPI002572E691|nr:Type 1 glutamine amidotransferase-like domain-containing protein [Gordonia sp. ABSL1-1]MDL9936052.1 Type 1 glutamine amidotransferase-like domain-containing protein [Gordonia sp. ABSL1-1]